MQINFRKKKKAIKVENETLAIYLIHHFVELSLERLDKEKMMLDEEFKAEIQTIKSVEGEAEVTLNYEVFIYGIGGFKYRFYANTVSEFANMCEKAVDEYVRKHG